MKNILISGLAVVMCAGPARAVEILANYNVIPTETAPVIDGKLDEPCWKAAETCDTYYKYLAQTPIKGDPETAFKMVYDSKGIYLGIINYEKFMDKIKDEQEILLAVADLAINIFAIESAVLRADKILPKLSESKKVSVTAAVKVFTFNGNEKVASAARRAAYYIEEGDTLTMLLAGIRRFTKYDATGLLKAKRQLAAAALEAEKYVF